MSIYLEKDEDYGSYIYFGARHKDLKGKPLIKLNILDGSHWAIDMKVI